MWVQRAAIRPVPLYAQVPLRALSDIESRLGDEGDQARRLLDEAFSRFEKCQPALSARVAQVLSEPIDETALALGYFLTLAVWLAFDRLFSSDINEISQTELKGVEESMHVDEELRLSDPGEAIDTDDVVAMEQPDILAFVHEHIDAALESNASDVDVDDVHAIYRTVMIEVLALSYAVRPPRNWALITTEYTA